MSQSKKYPKFSVLISVYRKENPKYLDLGLKRIEQQPVKPSEFILVEDGVIPDRLQEVILNHKEKFGNGFKIIYSSINRGLGNALRLGTNYVSTNWIARMDSDDYSVPNRFEQQLDLIIDRPNLAVVGGQVDEFSKNINNIVGFRKVPSTTELIYKFAKWRSPFNHPTVMINKKALKAVGGYQDFGNLEDYYLWVRFLTRDFDVCNVPETLVLMRVDSGLYLRRGKINNLRYFYKLRYYLKHKRLINTFEELLGDFIVTVNIIMPGRMRKYIYTNFLHTNS